MRTALVLCVLAIGIGLVALNWATLGPVVQSRWARLTGEFGAGTPISVVEDKAAADAAAAASATGAPSDSSATGPRLTRRSPSEAVRRALGMTPDGRLPARPAGATTVPPRSGSDPESPTGTDTAGVSSPAAAPPQSSSPQVPTRTGPAAAPASISSAAPLESSQLAQTDATSPGLPSAAQASPDAGAAPPQKTPAAAEVAPVELAAQTADARPDPPAATLPAPAPAPAADATATVPSATQAPDPVATAAATSQASVAADAVSATPPPVNIEPAADTSIQALTEAPSKVLERAPAEVLAQTLAEVPIRALEQLPAATVMEIARALPLPAPLDQTLAPKAPVSIARSGTAPASEAVRRKDGSALIQGTGERTLPAPIALAPPPSVAALMGDAAEGSRTPLAALSGAAQPATPAQTQQAARATNLELILNAPAEALQAVPKRVLAAALAQLAPGDLDRLSPALATDLPIAIEQARGEVVLDEQAQAYIEALTAQRSQPIAATRADHFVRRGQRLTLGDPPTSLRGTAAELLSTPDIDLDTPLRVARIEQALEPLDPDKLIAASHGNLSQPVQLVENDVVTEVPLHVALERHRLGPTRNLSVVREVKVYEPTTLAALQAGGKLPADARLEVVTGNPASSEALVEELLGLHRSSDPDSLYYIRTVRESDVQGVWGIIQSGLIDNFAKGMAVRRGEAVNAYKVTIPRDADERLADASSSFLGLLIHRKTAESTVFNIREGRMSRNPDLIRPGQQIVIVDFSPAELIDIYRHFAKLGKR